MKTLVTVCWANTVEIEVDPVLLAAGDEKHQDECRTKAIKEAWLNVNEKDGMVTDCESFPDLAE